MKFEIDLTKVEMRTLEDILAHTEMSYMFMNPEALEVNGKMFMALDKCIKMED